MKLVHDTFQLIAGTSRVFFAISVVGSLVAAAAAQSDSRCVFVANNVSDTVASFTIGSDDRPEFIVITPTGDSPSEMVLSPDGRLLAVSHATAETSELLQVFEVAADATLTLAADRLVPDSPLGMAWLSETVLAVTETSLGNPNFVHTYQVDAAAGTIERIGQ